MTEKSYVTLEQKVCIVCGNTYDSGALLLDQRLRPKFDMHTTTGWGMCEEDQKRKDDGYVAMIGCDEAKSDKTHNGNIAPEGAHRTGNIAHIRTPVWENIFNVPMPERMVCFCGDDVIDMLQKIPVEGEA